MAHDFCSASRRIKGAPWSTAVRACLLSALMARRMPPYFAHLSADPVLRPLLEKGEPLHLEEKSNVCLQLCRSILGQQLSTKVAAVIFSRFVALFSTNNPGAEAILAVPVEALRSIGLSGAKAAYVQNVARYFLEKGLTDDLLQRMPDEEVIQTLLPIKGVGRWTVEMLQMFTLGREDVFAPDDLGIRQAMTALYGLHPESKKSQTAEMIRIAEAWRPWRTYACLHLWRWKDEP